MMEYFGEAEAEDDAGVVIYEEVSKDQVPTSRKSLRKGLDTSLIGD